MTAEEAIVLLRMPENVEFSTWYKELYDDYNMAVDMAVEALSRHDDTISRLMAIKTIENLPRWVMDPDGEFQLVDPPTVAMISPEDAVAALEALKPAIIDCPDEERREE